MSLPSFLVAGTSAEFKVTVPSDFSGGDGHTLLFELANRDNAFTWTEDTYEGLTFTVNLTTTNTDQVPGDYALNLFAVKSGVKQLLLQSYFTLKPSTAATQDHRSHIKRVLDSIEATIENRATRSDLEVSINTATGSQSIKRASLEELMAARTHYRALFRQEQDEQSRAAGTGRRRLIFSRFTTPQ